MFLSTKISFKNSKFTLVEFPLTSLPTARVSYQTKTTMQKFDKQILNFIIVTYLSST